VGYYTKIGTAHGISNSSEFFTPNAEGVSPHDFVLDAVNRKVCSYKNFSLELFDNCEYNISNITGICGFDQEERGGSDGDDSGKSDERIKKAYSRLSYVLFVVSGLVTISVVLYAARFFFRRSKAKSCHRKQETDERLVLCDK